jgi:hypothetical protein
MQQLPPVTPYIESAFQLARTKYGVEHATWIDLSFRLAGRVSLAPLTFNLQRVGDLDLMLRAMEDEHVANATSEMAQGLSHAFHYQMMFSETWVVMCYEALRAIRQREREVADEARAKNPNHVPDDLSSLSTFKLVFTDFELLRMPIAKYEIAKDDKMKQPLTMRAYPPNGNATDDRVYDKDDPTRSHIMPTAVSGRGSVMWQVLDHSVPREYWVERRELADRMLKFRDEIELRAPTIDLSSCKIAISIIDRFELAAVDRDARLPADPSGDRD